MLGLMVVCIGIATNLFQCIVCRLFKRFERERGGLLSVSVGEGKKALVASVAPACFALFLTYFCCLCIPVSDTNTRADLRHLDMKESGGNGRQETVAAAGSTSPWRACGEQP